MFGVVKTFLSGINIPMLFYKILAVGAVSLIVLTLAYREGLHDGESRALAEQMGELKTQIREERQLIVKELTIREDRLSTRMNEIGADSKRAALINRKMDKIGDNLYEIIAAMDDNPACAPTPSMWEEYRKLAEATNATP